MRRLILSALALLTLARPAFAQPRLFVTGDVFADVKRFSGDTTSLPLDGNAFGAGVRIGTGLTPQWTAELGIDVGRFTTDIRDLTVVPLALPVRRQARTQNQLIATSAVIAFHPRATGRVQMGYFAGLTLLHAIRKTDTLAAGTPLATSARKIVDNVGAATMGIEARVGLSTHLAVVPEMRVFTFRLSGAGPSGFAIRPGVAARWAF